MGIRINPGMLPIGRPLQNSTQNNNKKVAFKGPVDTLVKEAIVMAKTTNSPHKADIMFRKLNKAELSPTNIKTIETALKEGVNGMWKGIFKFFAEGKAVK